MRFIYSTVLIFVTAILLIQFSTVNASVHLTGAGATFPSLIYVKWADMYKKETGNEVNYQGIGSSGGVKQIISHTIDFGASDVPLSDDQLHHNHLFQFPTVIGGIVVVINIPGIKSGELILDGKTLGNIYLGKIKNWNDVAIMHLNPHLHLPAQNIAVIRRADSSGTSFVFTNYLAKVNNEWKYKVGTGFTVNWPIGLGGKGNDGVATFVQRVSGSIGYIEYTYAKQNNMTYTKLISADGVAISPTKDSFAKAVTCTNWTKSLTQNLINQKGQNVWPITSATFVLIHKQQTNTEHGIEVLKFFDWAYKNGIQAANDLDYVSLPNCIVDQIHIAWRDNIKDRFGRRILY